MTTNTNNSAVISVRTSRSTQKHLGRLAKTTQRTQSSLANEALEQYIAHQHWMAQEIEQGVRSAQKDVLIPDKIVGGWVAGLQ